MWGAGGALLAVLVLAGCTGDAKSDSAASSTSAGSSGGGSATRQMEGTAAAPAAPVPAAGASAAASSAAEASSGGGRARTPLHAQALIVTVTRTVQVHDAVASARKAAADAVALGGRLDGEQSGSEPQPLPASSASSPPATPTLPSRVLTTDTVTLRVPTGQVDVLVRKVEAQGKVLAVGRTVQDVTQQSEDVAARLANARASVVRVRGFYSRATNVTQLVALERELSSRLADLESLERQSAALGAQTSLATVTATFTSTPPPAAKSPARKGFVAGLGAGWDGFTASTEVVLTALGAALPFAVPLLVLALLVWWARRLVLRRRSAPSLP
ncbi:DUF4349 domain-containing protein [Motilibacter rhizosphaerae]|nr:DUF4349 domain-containing protein [Motilibacter rhizosphaerae]